MTKPVADRLERAAGDYLAAALRGDFGGALRALEPLLEAGESPTVVLHGVLVPVQVAVGERWQDGRGGVAEEHAVTAVTERVLDTVHGWHTPVPEASAGRLALACAEGEWHGLAPRLLGVELALLGWDPVLLGASCPSREAVGWAGEGHVEALLVSVSMPTALPGARRVAEVAADREVPVLFGGAAFGASPHRARALGAGGWAASAEEADVVLRHWRAAGAPAAPPPLTAWSGDYAAVLDRRAEALAQAARGWLAHPTGAFDIVTILYDTLAAAVLVDDHSLFLDQRRWAERVVTSRGGHRGSITGAVETFAAVLADVPAARFTVALS